MTADNGNQCRMPSSSDIAVTTPHQLQLQAVPGVHPEESHNDPGDEEQPATTGSTFLAPRDGDPEAHPVSDLQAAVEAGKLGLGDLLQHQRLQDFIFGLVGCAVICTLLVVLVVPALSSFRIIDLVTEPVGVVTQAKRANGFCVKFLFGFTKQISVVAFNYYLARDPLLFCLAIAVGWRSIYRA